MSKGNINYKYLRRRKSWFRRNIPLVIIIAVVCLLIIGGIVLAVKVIPQTGIFNNNSKTTVNDQSKDSITDETESQTQKEAVWYEKKEEKVQSYINSDYKAPEGVALPYSIKINKAAECATVYGIDGTGKYSVPVRSFLVSCGEDEVTEAENLTIGNGYGWQILSDGSYVFNICPLSNGIIMCSPSFSASTKDTLVTEKYNELGKACSFGCIKMAMENSVWIFENCAPGTTVTIYSDKTTAGPFGTPESIQIPVNSEYAGWDPTDPEEGNPWKSLSPVITGVKNINTKVGSSVDLMQGVTAKDTCGNDVTKSVNVVGKYTFDVEGEYNITYMVTDALGRSTQEKAVIKVEK